MSKKKESILIVDDDKNLGTLLAKRFKALGYNAFTALNSESGVKIAVQKKPSVIILDIMMPVTDGFELCQLLRQKKSTQNIPILFLSGREQQNDKVKGIMLGADDYMTKPFDLQELEARVQALLRRRK